MKQKRPYWQVAVRLLFSIFATAAFIIAGVWLIGFLAPFVIGWIIASIAAPLVNWLEKRLGEAERKRLLIDNPAAVLADRELWADSRPEPVRTQRKDKEV